MSAIPIPVRGKPIAPSAPIPIGKPSGRSIGGATAGSAGYLSASVPAAPVIGSLKAPAALETAIPDLALPPSSPEAFSLVGGPPAA